MAALVKLWQVGTHGLLPVLLTLGGRLMTACCCSGSSSSSSSSSGSSSSSSGTGWNGPGWYCWKQWRGETCETLGCEFAQCKNLTYEGALMENGHWPGECYYDSDPVSWRMHTVAGPHATQSECLGGCAC